MNYGNMMNYFNHITMLNSLFGFLYQRIPKLQMLQ